MPYYQPAAGLQLFNRTIHGWDVATGSIKIDLQEGSYVTEGEQDSSFWNGPSGYVPPHEL